MALGKNKTTGKAVSRSVRYVMTISRLTVDKLGVKLYDKVSAVIAELVSNSYDADATVVTINAPMGEYLASRAGEVVKDKGFTIEVSDDGIGMTPEEMNRFYLRVGSERRKDERGDVSPKFSRKVMGNKGVGKLAPFGICERIEIVTAGGKRVTQDRGRGKKATGYLTANIILHRNQILKDEDFNYEPEVGPLDGTLTKATGTKVILSDFAFRKVPTLEEFSRQLAQRFGIQSQNWQVQLVDTVKTEDDPEYCTTVGKFDVKTMDNTEIVFKPTKTTILTRAFDSQGNKIDGLDAGFCYDGRNYPVSGWVAYAKDPYKDDLMAGVRIYCRGKIAAQTSIFNRRAGFTGEHDVRSYLVGELHADWLDENDDLIQTDRRDILWSHELGQQFEMWGQSLIKKIGTRSRDPMKKKTWDRFKEVSNLEERVKAAFPSKQQADLRENALEVAKWIGQTIRTDELEDADKVEKFVQLSLMLAPVITLDEKLRAAGSDSDSPLEAVTEILKTARIAELASFGRIAEDRIRVIERVEELKDEESTLESAFQTLIMTSPWLIDPQWSPITANQAFTTLRKEFAKFYKTKTGVELELDPFSAKSKRADFVMNTQDGMVQIIEIKKPKHKLEDVEFERIITYRDLMQEFLGAEKNKEFVRLFPDFHITLVCDGVKLKPAYQEGFKSLIREKRLTHISWETFLLRTRKMHQSFLDEADKMKRDAVEE
jgi:hypothetical protein